MEILTQSTRMAKKGCSIALSALKPSSLKEAKNVATKKLKNMTYCQMVWLLIKLLFKLIGFSFKSLFFLLTILWWFLIYSMGGRKDDDDQTQALPLPDHRSYTPQPGGGRHHPSYIFSNELNPSGTPEPPRMEAFGIQITPEEEAAGVNEGVRRRMKLKVKTGASLEESVEEPEYDDGKYFIHSQNYGTLHL